MDYLLLSIVRFFGNCISFLLFYNPYRLRTHKVGKQINSGHTTLHRSLNPYSANKRHMIQKQVTKCTHSVTTQGSSPEFNVWPSKLVPVTWELSAFLAGLLHHHKIFRHLIEWLAADSQSDESPGKHDIKTTWEYWTQSLQGTEIMQVFM
jgi:hypothetical protein